MAPTPELPPQVRFIAGFYLFSSLVGVVSAIARTIQALQGGMIQIALPVGVGLSAWAIGRGLLRGRRRAWWWARLIAGITPVMTIVFMTLLLFFADEAKVTTPWGTSSMVPVQNPWLLASVALVALFFSWQLWILTRPAVKRIYPRENTGTKPSPRKE